MENMSGAFRTYQEMSVDHKENYVDQASHPKQTLRSFARDWNISQNGFIFSIEEASGVQRPTGVEIRYPAAKYQDFYTTGNWNKLNDVVEAKSHGTMFVTTNSFLFERGIISLKISSMNHNYREEFIISTLRWVVEKFFPK